MRVNVRLSSALGVRGVYLKALGVALVVDPAALGPCSAFLATTSLAIRSGTLAALVVQRSKVNAQSQQHEQQRTTS